MNKLIFAHLNINSIRNKLEFLPEQIKGKINILMIWETKIDESFPQGKFLIDGLSSPYRLDRDSKGAGIMLYVRENIPSNFLASDNKPIESLYIVLNLQNVKMSINCSYNPHKAEIGNHLAALNSFLDVNSTKYDKNLILGDFNTEINDPKMQTFCKMYKFKSLIKQLTCYKDRDKPSCIDFILTNVPRMFQSTCVIETGLSDFHLMTVTVMRKTLKKVRPRIINYRSFKHFSNEAFRISLEKKLSREVYVNNNDGLERFCKITMDTLNKVAPIKRKYTRGNQMPFMTKELSKEIMARSRLRNKYLTDKTVENRLLYTQQRNKCVALLRNTKKNYYENLDEKEVTDNKKFWRTIQPYLSDKSVKSDKIHLNENGIL